MFKVAKKDPNKVSLAAWQQLVGYTPGIAYSSPFRSDNSPSFFILPNKKGEWIGKDAGRNLFYSIYQVLEKVKGWDWKTSKREMEKLKLDDVVLDTTAQSSYQLYKAKKPRYVVIPKAFGKNSLLNEYDIDYEVANEAGFTRNKYVIKFVKGEKSVIPIPEHSYSYIFPSGRIKVYNPKQTNYKWFGNCNKYDVYGIHHLENYDKVIITSSGKDMMLLKSIRNRLGLKYDVVAPNGEGYMIPEEYLYKFDNKEVILWFDNDVAGKLNASKQQKYYGARLLFNPHGKPKDPSDWYIENKDQLISFLTENI